MPTQALKKSRSFERELHVTEARCAVTWVRVYMQWLELKDFVAEVRS